MTRIVLGGVPARLFEAWEEHSDALLREYALGSSGSGHPYSLGDIARARDARIAVGNLLRAAQTDLAPSDSLDLAFVLPAGVAPGDYSVLQAVLEDANVRSLSGEFLTMPSLPEIVALRDWVCEEVVAQASGRAPQRWTGQAAHSLEVPLATWRGISDLPTDRAWLVGDDHNRIVAASEPAVRLLRWGGHDIIGQRILVVIPPRYREAHVARFTLATVTGEHRLLGRPLALEAWTHDGEEVPITLTLERHPAGGRSVYVAWFDDPEASVP